MRDLAGSRKLADAKLVEDLARLRVAPRLIRFGLERGEHTQRTAGNLGVDHHRLGSAQQRVATERRHVPGDPGSRQRRVADRHHQRVDVAHRGIDEQVEQLVVGANRCARLDPGGVSRLELRRGLLERPRGTSSPTRLRRDHELELDCLAGVELNVPLERRTLAFDQQSPRREAGFDSRLTPLPVSGDVGEAQPVAVARRWRELAL
jgi:hypothetical protein